MHPCETRVTLFEQKLMRDHYHAGLARRQDNRSACLLIWTMGPFLLAQPEANICHPPHIDYFLSPTPSPSI